MSPERGGEAWRRIFLVDVELIHFCYKQVKSGVFNGLRDILVAGVLLQAEH